MDPNLLFMMVIVIMLVIYGIIKLSNTPINHTPVDRRKLYYINQIAQYNPPVMDHRFKFYITLNGAVIEMPDGIMIPMNDIKLVVITPLGEFPTNTNLLKGDLLHLDPDDNNDVVNFKINDPEVIINTNSTCYSLNVPKEEITSLMTALYHWQIPMEIL